MKYIKIEPEVIVGLGDRSDIDFSSKFAKINHLHISLEDWLGDDLVECYPAFFVTNDLKIGMEKEHFTGFEIKSFELTFDEGYEDNSTIDIKPNFWWLEVTYQKGDDIYIDENKVLNVTESLYQFLQKYNLKQCTKFEDNPEIDAIFAAFEKKGSLKIKN